MKLPESVQEIAAVLGVDRALYLISQLPRCYAHDHRYPSAKSEQVILYVPTLARMRPDHSLVQILGWKDAEKLSREFGGEILKPANCAAIYRPFRDAAISRLLAEGVSIRTVAEWFDVSDRHVKNLTRENPQEERHAANDNNPPHQQQKPAGAYGLA